MKTVLITGATGNLGSVILSQFSKLGYQVVAIVRPGKKELSIHQTLAVYEADLSNEQATQEAVESIIHDHKNINAALLLAGGFSMGTIHNTKGDSIKKMLDLNFETAYNVARPVFQHMLNQPEGGKIVMIGARPVLETHMGTNKLAYTLSKTLLFKLAELLNAEGAKKNVSTSVIVPGIIDTIENRKSMPNANFDFWVKAEEIGEAINFICSNNALSDTVLKLYGKE